MTDKNHCKFKVGMVSLGCPKNLVDSEAMLGILVRDGFEVTPDADAADVIIVNTCAFIGDAKEESISEILEMAEKKKQGHCKTLIVTGCLAERYAESFAKELPEVDAVLGTGEYGRVSDVIRRQMQNVPTAEFTHKKIFEYSKEERLSHLRSPRILTTGGGYAYVKIAEGCDNHCSYCVIPSLRGGYASREIKEIIGELRDITSDRPKEIILVAQDTTRFGKDTYGEYKLCELLEEAVGIKNVKWIRLLYCYPDLIDDRLMRAISLNGKVVKYLDVPIQHASSNMLKAMGRRYDGTQLRELVFRLREQIPGIVLRTTLLTGFPGETEDDFERLKDFVEEIKFERLGVFAYSREEGTPAAAMRKQVSSRVAAKRRMEILKVQQRITSDKEKARVGQVYEAIVDMPSSEYGKCKADMGLPTARFCYGVRTYAEAPGIDGHIILRTEKLFSVGDFLPLKVMGIDNNVLWGVPDDEHS
ncbi:MAG: 30S ribosomal protein S12 methylthiotransferase RimO [Oscillospiraceae bacterium]|nr:30S ribosomal protein S12 methylthiotransferase RimO [Oscillospiraceae bacterium]